MTSQTADVHPIGGHADDTVRRTVEAVTKGKGLTRDDVAAGIGMPRSSYHRKISGKGAANTFSAGEVAAIAAFLGVSVNDIYSGFGGTFVPSSRPVDNPPSPRETRLARLTEVKRARARGDATRAYPTAA